MTYNAIKGRFTRIAPPDKTIFVWRQVPIRLP